MVEPMSKVVSVMTMQGCRKTSKGTQYQGASNCAGRPRQPQLAHGADGTLQLDITCFCCKETGHVKNCAWLNNKITSELAQEQATEKRPLINQVLVLRYQKIMIPQTLDQSEGDKVCGPDHNDKLNKDKGIVGLIEKISTQQVSAQIKIEMMQRAVVTCPKVNMGCRRKRIPSLLDSGSQVTLICQSF